MKDHWKLLAYVTGITAVFGILQYFIGSENMSTWLVFSPFFVAGAFYFQLLANIQGVRIGMELYAAEARRRAEAEYMIAMQKIQQQEQAQSQSQPQEHPETTASKNAFANAMGQDVK